MASTTVAIRTAQKYAIATIRCQTAGYVRDPSKIQQGLCEPCAPGTFNDKVGSWNTTCTNHKTCSATEWKQYSGDNKVDNTCTEHLACVADTQYQTAAGTSLADTTCAELQECDSGTDAIFTQTEEWEWMAPSPTQDRECKPFSAQCVVGSEYESTRPSPTENRECAVVQSCLRLTDASDTINYPGEYMLRAPNTTHDTVCSTLADCNYNTETIVNAQVDTASLSTHVYGIDRTCEQRPECHPDFERTVKDAYTTTCQLLDSQVITIT